MTALEAVPLALAILAGLLAVVELVRSRAASLLAWGLLAVAVVLTLPVVVT